MRALLATLALVLALTEGADAQAAFEDKNGDGLFNAGDVDLTAGLLAGSAHTTVHPVVIAKPIVQRCHWCTIGVTTTKSLTVLPGVVLSSTGYWGMVDLRAEALTVGPKVQLVGVGGVHLYGVTRLGLGDAVRVQASGSSPTYGYGTVALSGGVVVTGSGLVVDAFETVDLRATVATLTLGPLASLLSRRGDVSLSAVQALAVTSATSVRGHGVSVSSETGGVVLGKSRLTAAPPYLLFLMGATVSGDPALWTKPYAIYDDAHPAGLYVTR